MPFNGSGVFNRVYSWVTDAANGVFVDATRTDTDSDDIANGLSTCITRDGQSPATANIPMGSNKLTGLAAGTATGDALSYNQASGQVSTTFTVDGTTNGLVSFVAQNATSGTAARAGFTCANTAGTKSGTLRYFSAGFTTSGARVADSVALLANGTTAGLNVGTSDATAFHVYTNDVERIQVTSDGRLYGTALHNNAGAVTGTTTQFVASGTYTPTPSADANCSAITVNIGMWTRLAGIVDVELNISLTVTGAGTTAMTIALPIASNVSGTTASVTGIVTDSTDNVVGIVSPTGADAAQANWTTTSGGGRIVVVRFRYEMLA